MTAVSDDSKPAIDSTIAESKLAAHEDMAHDIVKGSEFSAIGVVSEEVELPVRAAADPVQTVFEDAFEEMCEPDLAEEDRDKKP